ncbi:MAG TPA: hypothetical protein VK435_07525 [Thermodesulfovibrionales bacterium]|nr:hypothetical protein [Thermodesulfovibrionales bacterium]
MQTRLFAAEDTEMSDLKKYVHDRKQKDKAFANQYETGYEQFKIGVMLRQARESSIFRDYSLARMN